jgi:2-polyprenyl-3-methyl-5-hydroxy-6-metoxy-1,4-benzoquinol methylase
MERRNKWFVEQIRAAGGRRVLELGCGRGETALYIASHYDCDVVAVDISERFIAHASKSFRRSNLEYRVADILADVAHLGRFDVVVGNGILHHLRPALGDVLRELRRLVGGIGSMAFIEPNFLNPYCAFIFGTEVGRRWAKLEPDERAFGPREIRRIIEDGGWQGVDVRTRDFLLPGLPRALVGPTLALEPALNGLILTRWLAQSHFVTAHAG